MPGFNKINDRLYQGSFPESFNQGIKFDVTINVSDSPCCSLEDSEGTNHFWLPINEWSVFPYEVFYGAKKILDANRDKTCLVFCHAGVCRSAIITYSYLLSIGREDDFKSFSKMWEYFIKAKSTSKAPPGLESFLRKIDRFPGYSVIGILQQIWKDDIEEKDPIFNYLKGKGLYLENNS